RHRPRSRPRRSRRRAGQGRSVPSQEQVCPPGLVALVREVRGENRVDVAARLERRAMEPEAGLLDRLAALAVVAARAGGDEVLPGVPAAAMTRDDVVERQIMRLPPAVLAGVAVAGEDLAPAQLDPRPGPADLVLEPDDGRRVVLGPRGPDDLVVVLDDLGLLAEHEPERPRQVADVQRLVVLVQDEDDPIHRGAHDTKNRPSCRRVQARPVSRPVAASQPPAWPTFVVSSLPSASAMNRAARRTPSRSTPCSRPI